MPDHSVLQPGQELPQQASFQAQLAGIIAQAPARAPRPANAQAAMREGALAV
jgi:hypothetical protein